MNEGKWCPLFSHWNAKEVVSYKKPYMHKWMSQRVFLTRAYLPFLNFTREYGIKTKNIWDWTVLVFFRFSNSTIQNISSRYWSTSPYSIYYTSRMKVYNWRQQLLVAMLEIVLNKIRQISSLEKSRLQYILTYCRIYNKVSIVIYWIWNFIRELAHSLHWVAVDNLM